jgi:hypothetical protein
MNKKYKILFSLLAITGLFMSINPVKGAEKDKVFSLPENAVEVTPNVFSLGSAYDKVTHSSVEGYAFIHKKEDKIRSGNAKPPKASGSCYAFMANGAKWKTVENWTMFPGGGLDGNFVLENTMANIAKWETSSGGANILGVGSFGSGTPSDPNILDEKNEVSFAHITDSNTIAVTIVWGTFSGPTQNRKLVAWDQIYNTNYSWSSTGEAGKMDYENISTHEIGHAMGMDHPGNTCINETMYAYADLGETKKRSLNTGDIAGISALY